MAFSIGERIIYYLDERTDTARERPGSRVFLSVPSKSMRSIRQLVYLCDIYFRV